MAKKASTSDSEQRAQVIKLRLTDDEARRIRVAAALASKRAGTYVRDVVLAHAAKLIAEGLK